MKKLLVFLPFLFLFHLSHAQINSKKFGKGFHINGKDSTFHMKIGLRFQNLFINQWNVADEAGEGLYNHTSNFLVRRARLKFDGFAYTPKLKYKFELGLTNRDNGGVADEFNDGPKFILDAFIQYNFYKNLSIRVGQGKLPGNRERVISSGNLQFVDRSRVNSRFNIDRDMGIQLLNHHKLGGDFVMKEMFAFSQGEGRNVTAGNLGGGFGYTFRVEFLPFGNFASKGDYVGAAVKREATPKLSVGISYDLNDNAARNRGQNGSFIQDSLGNYVGKNLQTLFVDAMFKYQGFSFMGEYADKTTEDGDPFIRYAEGGSFGRYYTGRGLNLAAGYLFKNNYEVALRYTGIRPDDGVGNDENEYTLGLSKYIVGHKLKIQSDLGYRKVKESDDLLVFRMQMDLHF